MDYSKLVGNITLKDIIEEKIIFVKENNIFDRMEYEFINEGEILAYEEMKEDFEKLNVQEFVSKYQKIIVQIEQEMGGEFSNSEKETEKISGYNNAIVSILELINPIHRYAIE